MQSCASACRSHRSTTNTSSSSNLRDFISILWAKIIRFKKYTAALSTEEVCEIIGLDPGPGTYFCAEIQLYTGTYISVLELVILSPNICFCT